MKNYHTKLLKLSLLTLFIHLSTTLLGSNLMDVKGRTILLTTPNDGINYAFDCFYDPIALEKGFKTKYIYNRAKGNVTPPEDILQRHFYVEDVIYDTYNDETLGVCVKLIRKDDNAKILFYIPPFKKYIAQTGSAYQRAKESAFSRLKHHSFYMAHCEWKHTNDLFSHQSVFNPISIHINYIDVSEVKSKVDTLENKRKETNLIESSKRNYNSQYILHLRSKYVNKSIRPIANFNILNQNRVFDGDYIRWINQQFKYSGGTIGGWAQYTGENPIECICKDIKLILKDDSKNPIYCYYAIITPAKENSDYGGTDILFPIDDKFESYIQTQDEFDINETRRLSALKQHYDEQSEFDKVLFDVLEKNYGKEIGNKIFMGIVDFGYTQEMCKLAKRHNGIYKIDKVSISLGLATRYYYPEDKVYFYFIEDKLIAILEYLKDIRFE